MVRARAAVAAALFVAGGSLQAQTAAPPASTPAAPAASPYPEPSTKVAYARRLQGASPSLDGRLDDAVWRQAAFFSDFIQKDPVEGAAPRERTEVAFLYDDDAVYVAIRCFADNPAAIQRNVSRRDGSGSASRSTSGSRSTPISTAGRRTRSA